MAASSPFTAFLGIPYCGAILQKRSADAPTMHGGRPVTGRGTPRAARHAERAGPGSLSACGAAALPGAAVSAAVRGPARGGQAGAADWGRARCLRCGAAVPGRRCPCPAVDGARRARPALGAAEGTPAPLRPPSRARVAASGTILHDAQSRCCCCLVNSGPQALTGAL